MADPFADGSATPAGPPPPLDHFDDGMDVDEDDEEGLEDDKTPYICVQVRNTDKQVQIFHDEFPEDVSELIDCLRAEVAPLNIWHKFAVEYYRQGKKEAFREILNEAKEGFGHFAEQPDLDEKEFERSRLEILNAICADYIMQFIEEKDQGHIDKLKEQVMKYLGQADRINAVFCGTWCCKAMFEMADGKTDNAKYWSDTVLKTEKDNVPATLVRACTLFQGKDWAGALKQYESVLAQQPNCNASVRVGIGLCCARLGQPERARAAFERALVLEPDNVEAAVGVTLLDLSAIPRGSSDRVPRQKTAVKRINALADKGVQNPMVLNHEANHTFWRFGPVKGWLATLVEGKTSVVLSLDTTPLGSDDPAVIKSEEVTESLTAGVPVRFGTKQDGKWIDSGGPWEAKIAEKPERQPNGDFIFHLSRAWTRESASSVPLHCPNYKKVEQHAGMAFHYTKTPEIKSESYYLLGRVEHARRNYTRAQGYYNGAIKQFQNFAPAHFGLAQIHLLNKDYDKAMQCLESCVRDCPETVEALHLLGKLCVRPKDGGGNPSQKMIERALGYLKRAVDLEPGNADVWLTRAQVLQNAPFSKQSSSGKGKGKSEKPQSHVVEAYEAYSKAVTLFRAREAKELAALEAERGTHVGAAGGLGATPPPPVRTTPSCITTHVLTNLGALQQTLGKTAEARESYFEALALAGKKHPPAPITEAKARTRLAVSEPANSVFWAWEAVEGAGPVSIKYGATSLSTSQDLSSLVNKGEQLRVTTSSSAEATVSLRLDVHADAPLTADSIPLKSRCLCPIPVVDGTLERKVTKVRVIEETKTTVFNLAILQEELGEWYAALELFKALLVKFPSHTDAYLRIGSLYKRLGSYRKGLDYCQRAHKVAPGDPTPLAMTGAMQMALADERQEPQRLEVAKSAFEKIQKIDKKYISDPFANLSIGNLYYTNLHQSGDQYSRHLKWSNDYFRHVLTSHKSNGFAANGVAMTLAEEGHLEQAKDIFGRVKTAAGDILPDAAVNLAHCHTLDKECLQAVKNYTAVLKKKHYGHDAELLLFIAHAHFRDKRHKEALRSLARAIRVAPHDLVLWQDIACVQYDFAVTILNKDPAGATELESLVDEMEAAQAYVETALRLFRWILQRKQASAPNGSQVVTGAGAGENGAEGGDPMETDEAEAAVKVKDEKDPSKGKGKGKEKDSELKDPTREIDEKKISEVIAVCEKVMEGVPQRLETARRRKDEIIRVREEQQRQMAEALARQRDERAKKKEEEDKKKLEMQERAKAKMEQVRLVRESLAISANTETKSKKKGKKGEGEGDFDEDEGDGANDASANTAAIDFGSDSEDEVEEPGTNGAAVSAEAKNAAEDLFGSDSEDDDAATAKGTDPPAAAAKEPTPQMNELGLEDSDDEEESGNAAAAATAAAGEGQQKGDSMAGLGLEDSDDEEGAGSGTAAADGAAGAGTTRPAEAETTEGGPTKRPLADEDEDDDIPGAGGAKQSKRRKVVGLEDSDDE